MNFIFTLLALAMPLIALTQNEETLIFKIDESLLNTVEMKKVYKQYDKLFNKTVIYSNRLSSSPSISFEIVIIEDVVTPMFELNYSGSEWIFANSVTIVVNDNKINIPLKSFDRKVLSGASINEKFRFLMSEGLYNLLKDFKATDELILRFHGKSYYSDRSPGNQVKSALVNMILIYERLKQIEVKD